MARKHPARPRRKKTAPLASEAPPDQLTPPQEEHRRTVVTAQAARRRDEERLRRDDLRFNMLRSVLTEPLLSKVQENPGARFDVIISLNERYKGGIDAALLLVEQRAKEWDVRHARVSNYVFACLTGAQLLQLADETQQQIKEAFDGRDDTRTAPVIYRIWEDNDVHVTLTRSLTTIKAEAAQRAFHARGDGIVWAVLDSGVQGDHVHFTCDDSPFGRIQSLRLTEPVSHLDFTPDGRRDGDASTGQPLRDSLGHGTHVASIIAGYWKARDPAGEPVVGTEMRNEQDAKKPLRLRDTLAEICGVAPSCRIVSLKVSGDKASRFRLRDPVRSGIDDGELPPARPGQRPAASPTTVRERSGLCT